MIKYNGTMYGVIDLLIGYKSFADYFSANSGSQGASHHDKLIFHFFHIAESFISAENAKSINVPLTKAATFTSKNANHQQISTGIY